MDIMDFELDDTGKTFGELTAGEKVLRLFHAYDLADGYRNFGEQSYLFGYEGDQFCRFLADALDELRDAEGDIDEQEEIADRVYGRASECYLTMIRMLDAPDEFPKR